MATYDIAPRQSQAGYKVTIIDKDGVRHTVLGFETKAEAENWIAADQDIERLAEDRAPPSGWGLRSLRDA
jgi:hypothetical protein